VQAISIEGPNGPIDATVFEPATARHTLILAHGAGAGQRHPWMRARAADFGARGVRAVTFDFPYITNGKKVPDRPPVLLGVWRAVVEHVAASFPDGIVAIGGKSMGGRMATMLVAEPDAPGRIAGCVALGYPLHPPGRPDQLRVAHLRQIAVPLLVVQGEKDPFGSPDDISREFSAAGAQPRVIAIPHGGHGFEVRVRDGKQADVYARIADDVTGWLDTLQPSIRP